MADYALQLTGGNVGSDQGLSLNAEMASTPTAGWSAHFLGLVVDDPTQEFTLLGHSGTYSFRMIIRPSPSGADHLFEVYQITLKTSSSLGVLPINTPIDLVLGVDAGGGIWITIDGVEVMRANGFALTHYYNQVLVALTASSGLTGRIAGFKLIEGGVTKYDALINDGSGNTISSSPTNLTLLNPIGDDSEWVLLGGGGGGPITHEGSISLLSSIQATTSKQAVFGASTGFTVDNGLDKGSQAVFETASSIASQLGFQSTLGAFINASATYNNDVGQLSIAIGSLIAQSTIDFGNSIQSASQSVLGAGAALVTSQSILATSGSVLGASAALTTMQGILNNTGSVLDAYSALDTSQGMFNTSSSVLDASADLGTSQGIEHTPSSVLGASSEITHTQGVISVSGSVLDSSTNLVLSSGNVSTSNVSTEAGTGFALNSNQVSVSQQDFLANSEISSSQGISGIAESDLLASMSLGEVVNLQSVAGLDIVATASLLVSTLLSTSYSTAIEGTGSYGVSCAIASQVIAELTSDASFEVVSGLISQANAILLAQAQLNTGNTFSVKSGIVIEAYGELVVTSSIGSDGVVVLAIEFKPLKDGHNVLVLAQNKTVTVTKQDRNIIVLN